MLDWLATEFIASGWSLKHLHKLIVTSAAYRQQSGFGFSRIEDGVKAPTTVDAGSRYLWRFPPRRLDAETIRDSILSISRGLDLKMGGLGVNIYKPKGNFDQWKPKDNPGPESWRRMINLAKMRGADDGMFTTFDLPDCGQVRAKRSESTTPLQALNLLNGAFTLEQAQRLAERVQRESGDDLAKQIDRLFALTLARPPNASERTACLAAAQTEMKLLFSDQQDITNTWGKIHFGTSALQHIRACENPGFELSLCLPREDGAWDVYGRAFQSGPPEGDQVKEANTWQVIHATTRDGSRFENIETVYKSEPGPWTFNHAMAYNPDAKEFRLLMLKMENFGFGYTAFFSPDGRTWKEHPKNPLYYDGDAISLFWSPVAKRFICVAKSFQIPFSKHIPDHGGTARRVLSIRSSRDGRTWEPSESVSDIWNRSGKRKALPVELLTLPDEQDPPDLEFYSGNGFSHHDRCYLMVLNYAGTPLHRGKHGPQLDTEWWVGRDGLRWERPGRDVNALGGAFPGNARITHNPMIIGGQFLFHFGNHLVGMKQDRISYVGARANAEFSTTPFAMPQGDLLLNAAVPSPDRAFAAQQAYVMVAVLDEKGAVVPGFEAEKCLIQTDDKIDLPLLWNGKSARELAGQTISLRFHLRSANIYAVTFRK